jgi:hypothetical protein
LSCVDGATKILLLDQLEPGNIVVAFFFNGPETSKRPCFMELMTVLPRCRSLSQVKLYESVQDELLLECLDKLECGGRNSSVQQIFICEPQVSQMSDDVDLNFGSGMRSMWLYGCKNEIFTQKFLEAAVRAENLASLMIEDCKLGEDGQEILREFLHQDLQMWELRLSRSVPNASPLLSVFASLANLDSLSISIGEMDRDDEAHLQHLLSRNQLKYLNLTTSAFSAELCSILSKHWQNMPALSTVILREPTSVDPTAFGQMLGAMEHLNPTSVWLWGLKLSTDGVQALCNAITAWENLQTLRLINITTDSGNLEPDQLEQLFFSVKLSQKLNELSFKRMRINQASLAEFLALLQSLNQLKVLNLCDNLLEANDLKELSQCLSEREDRIEFLDVRKNPGVNDPNVMEDLQLSCNAVEFLTE